MKFKTMQGKEFEYKDILLYNVIKDQIFAIVNDQEQLKQFAYTGKGSDAPLWITPYSKELEEQIINEMKRIQEYSKEDGCINILYKDGTTSKVALESEEVVKKNLEAQREMSKKVINSSWAELPVEEKQERKKKSVANWKRGLAGVLAAITIYAVGANKDKISAAIIDRNNNSDKNPKQTEEVVNYNRVDITNNDRKYYEEVTTYDFTDLGRILYNETQTKDNFVLKYQQVVNINWDQELATMIVELINGKYPEQLLRLSDEDAFARETEALQALSLLVAGNQNTETRHSDIIDLSRFFLREQDIILVNNAMVTARNAMDESVGEPMNGQIIAEKDYASVDKFSREYLGAVDQLLNYQYDTLNDPKFKQMSSGARWTIASIFQQVDNTIPQWDKINRNGNPIYYRSFVNKATNDKFNPEIGPNGTVDYISQATGKKYNMYEMYALAGVDLVEEQRNVNAKADPNIQMVGIEVSVDEAVQRASDDMYALREIAKDYTQTKGAK